MTPQDYLESARVPRSLKPQAFGPWMIARIKAPGPFTCLAAGLPEDWVGFDDYTVLRRLTEATLHIDGEIVMEDSRRELRRHLTIWLAARGRVLVTGLGLGCVVRGLLASPDVEHVDVIEIDRGILRVVGHEFYGNSRVTLRHGDALTYEWPSGSRWDYAWHDIWTEEGSKLQLLHAELIKRYYDNVGIQGAWQFPKIAKRRCGARILK